MSYHTGGSAPPISGNRNGTTYILGAGFSKCAGLPVQAEFSDLIFSPVFPTALDKKITRVLTDFLRDVFQWRPRSPMPELEDIFTCIDLSANTGHQLGLKYTPKVLRAIRRLAIHRIFSILDQKYALSDDILALLNHALNGASTTPNFIVLNWDIVLEKHLRDINMATLVDIDYGCDSVEWSVLSVSRPRGVVRVPVCKMHGSSNWLYCENCKSLFYDLDSKRPLHAEVGLVADDFRLFDKKLSSVKFESLLKMKSTERACRRCGNEVASHIATFSYRKSFRTHAYSAIWHRAEDLLANSKHWVFIGYSLPKADFELKSLLKAAEIRYSHLTSSNPVQIDVVVKGDAPQDYRSFFGPKVHFFDQGLKGYVTSLRQTGSAVSSH
jgi:hypothetical protein